MEPTITINGKTIKPATPKAKIWREIMKFEETRGSISYENAVPEYARMIAEVFANVTAEQVEDNVDIDDIVPLYRRCFGWVCSLLTRKLANLPNVQTPAE